LHWKAGAPSCARRCPAASGALALAVGGFAALGLALAGLFALGALLHLRPLASAPAPAESPA
jgi:hypothetical protein